MPGSHPKTSDSWKNWTRLLAFLAPYKGRFALSILFGIFNSLSNLLLFQGIPTILGLVFRPSVPSGTDSPLPGVATKDSPYVSWMVDRLQELWSTFFGTEPSRAGMIAIILLVPCIMFLRAITDYLSQYFMSWVGVRIITDIRQKVFVHIQSLSLDFFNKSNVGDLISRLVNDCQQAQSAITTVIADSIKHPFTIVVIGWALLHKDFNFSISAVILAPLCILPIAIYGRKIRRISKLSQENQGEILSRLHENFTGVRVVKGFGMETLESKKFWNTCYRQFGYQMKIVRSVNILNPMIEIVASVGVVAALIYARKSGMDLTQLIALLIGIWTLYNPIKSLSKLHTTIQKSLASTERIFAILDTQATVREASSPLTLKPIQHSIQFEGVSFRYDSHDVLKNVQLTIPHGKTIALVGPSGGGKTTLLNMVLRFYDPSEGKVTIDGMDLKTVSFQSLRSQMGLVAQETILFDDTIRNNLRYGSPHATDAQIEQAARQAFAHDFILQQPLGYDTMVGEKGVKLSGGQKQRLAIARAILRNPSILLLDEATSALDTESERYVQAALDQLIKGRTVIVIAHRLSTVQKADLIVVLDQGRIIEEGTHERLLQGNQLYKKLYDLQFADTKP